MKRALGVDLSDYTGWAVLEQTRKVGTHKLVECGLLQLKPGRFDSYGSRYVRQRKAMTELIRSYKPDIVCYEVWAKHAGVQAAQVLGGHLAVLTEVCETEGVQAVGFSVQRIKRHATGNGMSKKDVMMAAAKALWPQADLVSDDVADALHIARLGLDVLFAGPDEPVVFD